MHQEWRQGEMVEFVAFHPENETRGSAIAAAVEVIGYERLVRALYRYGLTSIQRDAWYPQQTELDLLRDMQRENSVTMLAVGMALADSAMFAASGVRTLLEALLRLNEAYQLTHRGHDIGSYAFQIQGKREGVLSCRTPYPADLEYGLLYRLAYKFRPPETTGFRLHRLEAVPDREGNDERSTFYLAW